MAAEALPDVVVMDLAVPEKDGWRPALAVRGVFKRKFRVPTAVEEGVR